MRPGDEAELAESIAGASGPLRIQGGGTRSIGNPITGETLETSNLSGITLYEPGALTLVAQAGTPLAEIETALAAEGQRLAFEPPDYRHILGTQGGSTIGGVVATNASGPRRVQVGACRDFLLGVRFVDGRGQVIKNGGRVMKNVTGYDLTKLLSGSHGTLGVLSEVALKVLPEVEAGATVILDGLDVATAVAAMSAALGSPFEVTGAAHLPDGRTVLRIEGFAESVRYRAERLTDLLTQFGDATIDADFNWTLVRDVTPFQDKPGDIWRFSVKPSDAPGMIDVLERLYKAKTLTDWGGGLIWVLAPSGADIRPYGLHGHATLFRAGEETKSHLGVFHPEPAPLQRISSALRAKFDPRNILNPGLMAPRTEQPA